MFGHQEPDQHKDDKETQTAPTVDSTMTQGVTVSSDTPSTPAINDAEPEVDYIATEPQPISSVAPDTKTKETSISLPSTSSSHAVSSELLDLKQKALQQLSPLIDHLDQTPEEKFRTTMMMIQASDDQSLIKAAYGTAQQISDEKTRAQALLDIVNEINYFAQQQES